MRDLPSLTPKPGEALPTSRLQTGAVSMYHEFISKMALGFHLSYREVLETSEGPFHPCGHRAASRMQLGLICLRRWGSHRAKAPITHQGAPPRGHNQQTRGPRSESPPGPCRQQPGLPSQNHHPYHWRKAGHWEPGSAFFPPHPPLPFTHHRAPSL